MLIITTDIATATEKARRSTKRSTGRPTKRLRFAAAVVAASFGGITVASLATMPSAYAVQSISELEQIVAQAEANYKNAVVNYNALQVSVNFDAMRKAELAYIEALKALEDAKASAAAKNQAALTKIAIAPIKINTVISSSTTPTTTTTPTTAPTTTTPTTTPATTITPTTTAATVQASPPNTPTVVQLPNAPVFIVPSAPAPAPVPAAPAPQVIIVQVPGQTNAPVDATGAKKKTAKKVSKKKAKKTAKKVGAGAKARK
jgi:hypothetical protein